MSNENPFTIVKSPPKYEFEIAKAGYSRKLAMDPIENMIPIIDPRLLSPKVLITNVDTRAYKNARYAAKSKKVTI